MASGTGKPRQSNNRRMSDGVVLLVVVVVVEMGFIGGVLMGWRVFR